MSLTVACCRCDFHRRLRFSGVFGTTWESGVGCEHTKFNAKMAKVQTEMTLIIVVFYALLLVLVHD
jgi:hypothetical protein